MSIEAVAIVLNHSRASGTDKVVLIGIANHDGDGGAYPSIGTLARYANVDTRTVQRSLTTLAEMGEIEVTVKGGGRVDSDPRYRTNRYVIHVTCPDNCDRTKNHRLSTEIPTEPVSEVTPTSPLEGSEVTRVTPRGDKQGHPEVTPTSPKPSLLKPSINQVFSPTLFNPGSGAIAPFTPQPNEREQSGKSWRDYVPTKEPDEH